MATKKKSIKSVSSFRNKYRKLYNKARKSPTMRTGVTNATGG